MKGNDKNYFFSGTKIKKFQFKKFSQVFIAEILLSSFKKKNKIFFKQFLNVFFLDYGKNLLYTEIASEIDFDFPPQIISTTSFLSEITSCEKRILKIFHVENFVPFFKILDIAIIKKGKDRQKVVKIEKLENDFVFFTFFKKDDLVSEKKFPKKKTNQLFLEKNKTQKKFFNRVKIDHLSNFRNNIINNQPDNIFAKTPEEKNNEIYIKNKGKIFADSRDFSIKILIGQEFNFLKFLNLNEKTEIISVSIAQKVLKILKTDLAIGKDFFNHIIFCGNFVKIISGPHQKTEGIVKFIKEKLIILECLSVKKNNGFLIISSDNVSVIEKNIDPKRNLKFLERKKTKNSSEKMELEIINKGKLINISRKNLALKKFI
ncbi:hypothetical protein HAN_3g446 (nucleomorph) [Hemiselmis andersenii]|uniref:Uncharacterized protein n=2 Tax=Hemiselmis andersenii TaxID=464988 RepID=A9BL65_HEMAN|nr:hypothetical protein HAN_3g446 [Hemiselmis andersenii]ABW98248.1 hypothetical protein HAN_3g446 [Hemiselmis andersenii]|mmetsp:Transcript_61786/g.148682  ORF Transcript_61786/g.148682 Transcript_61786/m.148682 type:complete len:374 (-) Transcript_61786:333-1454(-)